MVAAAVLKDEGFQVELLMIDYGCRATWKEHKALKDCAKAMGMPHHIAEVAIGGVVTSGLIQGRRPAKELSGAVSRVNARNLILISLAAGYCMTNGIPYIGHGNIAHGGNPDNYPEFTQAFNNLLPFACGLECPQILMPINYLDKWEVVKAGKKLNVPMELTWSCYLSGETHCGECASCVPRKKAFAIAGMVDPVPYAK